MTDSRPIPWRALDPARASALVDARLQLHHAAQLATAMGISYLPPKPDDSHTNLEWLPALEALASNVVRLAKPMRLAVRPNPFALLVLDEHDTPTAELHLNGRTVEGIVRWIRAQLGAYGLDAARYTLKRHYQIPHHPVADNAAFDATHTGDFEQLAAWYSNAARLLAGVAAANPGASPIRCWPHHFDIATLLDIGSRRTIGVGMEPGDASYAEPYFYVNRTPPIDANAQRPALDGGGTWHTQDWIGAVLTGSKLSPTTQREQCETFLRSAVQAMLALTGR